MPSASSSVCVKAEVAPESVAQAVAQLKRDTLASQTHAFQEEAKPIRKARRLATRELKNAKGRRSRLLKPTRNLSTEDLRGALQIRSKGINSEEEDPTKAE